MNIDDYLTQFINGNGKSRGRNSGDTILNYADISDKGRILNIHY